MGADAAVCAHVCACFHTLLKCVFLQRKMLVRTLNCVYVCVYSTVWVIGPGPYQQQTENHTEPDPGESHWHGKTASLLLCSSSHFLFHSHFFFLFSHRSLPRRLSHPLTQTCSPHSTPPSLCASPLYVFFAHPLSSIHPDLMCAHSPRRHKMHYGSSLSGQWSLTCTHTSLCLSGHTGVDVCVIPLASITTPLCNTTQWQLAWCSPHSTLLSDSVCLCAPLHDDPSVISRFCLSFVSVSDRHFGLCSKKPHLDFNVALICNATEVLLPCGQIGNSVDVLACLVRTKQWVVSLESNYGGSVSDWLTELIF